MVAESRIRKHAFPLICAGLFLVVASLVCVPALTAKKPKYKIKIGSYVTPNSVWGKTVKKTMKNVKKRSKGEAQIVHIHSGQAGSAQNMLEQVLLGGLQAAGIPSSNLANLVPEAHIIEMPFLFKDRDEAYYLLDNVIGPMLAPKFEAKGLKTSALMESGFMDIVAPRAINKPEDVKKIKIGSWDSPVHVAFWKALGGKPNPIPATEVFRAYTTGQVDSGSNNPNAIMAWDALFGSAIDRSKIHITDLDFSYQSGVLVVNKKYWDSMPKNIQKIFEDELNKLTVRIRTALTEAEPKSVKALKKKKYGFHSLSAKEKQVFVDKTKKVYDEFESIIGKKFLAEVLAERSKYRKTH